LPKGKFENSELIHSLNVIRLRHGQFVQVREERSITHRAPPGDVAWICVYAWLRTCAG
jgi:hypothetical protein